MINIGGQKEDDSYRYKMPALKAKKEGRGNGVKTVFENIADVSKCLHIEPIYPTKFLGIELGAHAIINKKTGRCVVTGHHTTATLQALVLDFVQKYILCDRCKLPETTILVDKKRVKVIKKCVACGIKTLADPSHKLTTFIAKKPPSYKNTGLRRKDQKAPEKRENSEEKSAAKEDSESDAEDWEAAGGAEVASREEEALDRGGSILHDMLRSDCSPKELLAEVGRMEVASPAGKVLGKLVIAQSVVEALFRQCAPKNAPAVVDRHRAFLAALARADERNESNLLDALEDYVGQKRPDFLRVTPLLLERLYDCGALGEDAVLEWERKGDVGEKVRESCRPFLQWLKEADEESSD